MLQKKRLWSLFCVWEKRIMRDKKNLAWLAGVAIIYVVACYAVKTVIDQQVKYVEKPIKLVKAAKSKPNTVKYVRSIMDKNHLAGTVGIVKNGKIKAVTSGMADLENITFNSSKRVVYPVGSLQKEVTGAMIMQIMRKKKFNQNTKISRWYPNLKNARQVTVGNLLTHTSGYVVPTIEYARYQTYTDAGAIYWAISQINMVDQRPVGSYRYNDVNFVLLAGIIEKETGKSYSRNFYQRVAKPLKLTHTYIRQDLPKKLHMAVSYRYNYRNPVSYDIPVSTQLPGAGNLLSTPEDFYKIQLGLENGKILTKKEFHQLTHLKTKKKSSGGVYIKKHDNIHQAYGALNKAHYGAYMQLTKDNKNGIIMMVNQRQQNEKQLKKIAYQILKQIKPHTFSKY